VPRGLQPGEHLPQLPRGHRALIITGPQPHAAAIDTIAEVGCARASLGRTAERFGVSKGLISYHFAGRDEL
jgi:hypothetical protein